MERLVHDTFEQSYFMPADEGSDVEMLNGTSTDVQVGANMFNRLDTLPPPQSSDRGTELNCYLTTDIEHVTDAIAWWHEHHIVYPCLSRMVLDYLSIPGTYFIFSSCIFSFTDITVSYFN